jgi:hypothetical protein
MLCTLIMLPYVEDMHLAVLLCISHHFDSLPSDTQWHLLMHRQSNICVTYWTPGVGTVFIRYHKRTGGIFHDGKAGLSVTVSTHRHLVSRQRLLEGFRPVSFIAVPSTEAVTGCDSGSRRQICHARGHDKRNIACWVHETRGKFLTLLVHKLTTGL